MRLGNLTFLSYNALNGGGGGGGEWMGCKFLFSITQTSSQKLLCQIVGNIGAKRFHIITRSYAASFSIRRVFVKLTTFSTAKKTKNETKPMLDSEGKSKIRVRLR